MSDKTLDQGVLLGEIEGLLHGWGNAYGESLTHGRRARRSSRADGLLVFGFAAHAHRLGEAVLVLHRADMLREALPLVRLMWELAWSATWAVENPEGAWAIGYESNRKEKALAEGCGAELALIHNHVRMPRDDIEKPGSATQAKYFERLCKDLEPDGDAAYVHYRNLSKYSHASASAVDPYLDIDGSLTRTPKDLPDPELWLFLVAVALVRAGAALNFMEQTRERRSELRAAARRLGIEFAPTLTFEARRRVDADERARRRSRTRVDLSATECAP